jgi:hypothetical protein
MVDFCSAENPFRPVASPEEAGTLGVFQRFSGEIECPECVTFHLAGYRAPAHSLTCVSSAPPQTVHAVCLHTAFQQPFVSMHNATQGEQNLPRPRQDLLLPRTLASGLTSLVQVRLG